MRIGRSNADIPVTQKRSRPSFARVRDDVHELVGRHKLETLARIFGPQLRHFFRRQQSPSAPRPQSSSSPSATRPAMASAMAFVMPSAAISFENT